MGWNCSAYFIVEWAGIHPPIFHFAMDQHAIIADMDRPFIAAYDFIAASRASPKCKSLLITLNQVGMLCLNEPVAPNLPPLFLFPSHPPLPLPFPSPSMGSLLSAAEAADPAAAAAAAAARATAVPVGGLPLLWARSRRRCWPSIVVTLRCLAPTSLPPSLYRPSCPANGPHPAMRTRRRRAPTGPAAGSPGLDKAAPGVADIKHSSLRKAMQRRHAAASRTSRNRSKNPAGYMAGDLGISRKISKDMIRMLKDK